MEFGRQTLAEATEAALSTMPIGTGGLIAVDAEGNMATPFTSPGMFRGSASSSGLFTVNIWE